MLVPAFLAAVHPGGAVPAAAEHDLAAAICGEVPRLRRLVHRLLGWRAGGAELDDVVQDVLLKAWRERGTFRGDAALTTWLVRIALTTAADHARAARRRRRFGWLLGDVPARRDPSDAAAATADTTGEPLDRTQRALQRLRHDDREVLVLRYLEQRPIPDVAALLGCSRAAADARLSRARARLRAELGLPEAP
jgi:RNA polymerase sigma-70 factor (ECF subfamily)